MLIGFGATLAVGLLALGAASAAIGVAASPTSCPALASATSRSPVSTARRGRPAHRPASHRSALARPRPSASTETEVPYADLGRGYEIDAMLDAASGVGRDGDPIGDGIVRLRTLVHATALPVIVHPFDAEALGASRPSVATAVSEHPLEAAVLRDGTRFAVRDSRGRRAASPLDVAPPSARPWTRGPGGRPARPGRHDPPAGGRHR